MLAKQFFVKMNTNMNLVVKVCPKNYGYVRAQSKQWPNVRKIAESGHPGYESDE
jgi:hypothetical protein